MYYIDVPVKPFVKKYIQARYGCEIFEIKKDDRIGKVFYAFLGRKPATYDKRKPDLGSTLMIKISEWHVFERGFFLSTDHIMDLNAIIRMELIEEISNYINNIRGHVGTKKYAELYIKQETRGKMRTRVGHRNDVDQYFERKEIIRDILKKYNITEDDFPFDTIDKACRRLTNPLLTA